MIKRYNGFMILVMNKKHGVGCTTLTYNLGRLFELPIFVKEDSFMFDNEHKVYFEDVGKITTSKREGIFDIGAEYNKAFVKRFIENDAKVVVIPLDFGYETIVDTITTIQYVQELNEELPIILILNRLDKQDSDKDFNYKEYLKLKFEDAGIDFRSRNLVLTYLRNSYGLYSNFDVGSYFMDNFFKTEPFREKEEHQKYIENFEYKKFLHFVNIELSRVDYRNEKIYIQDKDMVTFRNNFKEKYPDYERNYNYFLHQNKGKDSYYKYDTLQKYLKNYQLKLSVSHESKLVKDMAFICHNIFECITDEKNIIRRTMYRHRW